MRTSKPSAYRTAFVAFLTAAALFTVSGTYAVADTSATFAIAATTDNERIAAFLGSPSVIGWQWTANLAVSVQVTGPGFDETQVGNTGDGFFSFEFSAMEPGFLVTATAGGHTETHIVARLFNVTADEASDTVSGNADVGMLLTAWVNADTQVERIFTVTSDPFTSPSFTDPPGPDDAGTADLVPGTDGGVFWQAADGNYTAHRWSIPNPTVRANWIEDYVTSNSDWPVGAEVLVEVADGFGVKCFETLTVLDELHEEGGEPGFEWSAPCDIVPSDVVTAATGDGPDGVTTSVELTPLQIVGFDEVSDLVIGVAALDSEVHVNGGNDESWGWRNVIASGITPPAGFDPVDASLGWWVADFTEGALSGGAEGDGWVDIRSGTGGEASQPDGEGDETFEWWSLEDPWIVVHRDESRVGGGSFDPGPIPLTVDDPATTGEGNQPDFATSVDVDESGYFGAELGEFITIESGFVVTAGEKTLVVSNITVTSINEVPGVVAGIAELDVPVEVWIHDTGEWRQDTSDPATGAWLVTFSSLWPGVAGGALVADGDGDSTQVDWGIPNPSVRANWDDDYVQSNEDWPFGALVTVTVENDVGAVKCVTDPPVEVVDWDGWTGFDWKAPCDIVPGDVVTATTGDGPDDITRSVEVTPVQIMGVDEAADLVIGVADLGAEIHVNGGNDASWGWRNVVADGPIPLEHQGDFDPALFGWWVADLTEAGLALALDGDGWLDIQPGTGGEASQSDADGDQIFEWWNVQEPPNPSVRANWVDDYVQSNEDWPFGALVTVTVESDAGAVKCVTDPPVEVVDWDGWTGFDWPAPCDIVPGDVVTATTGDGPDDITRSVEVTPLQFVGVAEDADLVFGAAPLDSEVHVHGGNEDSWGWRILVADGPIPAEHAGDFDGSFGWWVADFTENGYTTEHVDGWGTVDIRPGTGGEASQSDPDGDQTFEWWNAPQPPAFTVQLDWSDVWGSDFDPEVELRVGVDVDPLTNPGPDHYSDWFFPDEWGNFHQSMGEVVTIEPGHLVTVGEKSLTVMDLTAAVVPGTSTVAGTADPDVTVQVWIHEESGEWHQTPSDGNWSVDFSTELSPGTQGAAAVPDEDGDFTQVDWRIPNPQVRANWVQNVVTSNEDWPVGAEVLISFDRLPETCDRTVTVTADPEHGWVGFHADFDPDTCDIEPGEGVTATSGDITAAVEVTPLKFLGVDEEFDLVFGVADLGAEIHVNGGNDESWGWRNVVADGAIPLEYQGDIDPASFGWWVADFTEAGYSLPGEDGDGTVDIRPGTGGEASQSDPDGDQTFEWWNVEEPAVPAFSVHRQHDWVHGGPDWAGPVTVSVDDLSWEVPVDPDEGFFLELWDVFDILEGQEFTVTGADGTTKTHMVTGIDVGEPDPLGDTVEGAAFPDNEVVVWIHDTDVYRVVIAGHEWPNWHVDFGTLGLAEDENGVFDLVPGTAGGATELDDDGDGTVIEWNVNRPPIAEDDFFWTDEDNGLVGMDVLGNDWDPDGDAIAYASHDTTGTIGEVVWDGATFEYHPRDGFAYLGESDLATDSWTYVINDGRGGSDAATVTVYVTGVNDAPEMSDQPDQEVQYSDGLVPIVFTATDADTDHLEMWASGLPGGLSAVSACSPGAVSGVVCTLTISGTVTSPVGDYWIEVTAGDGEFHAIAGTTITVMHEDADVSLHGGNDTAIPVAPDDESGPFELMFKVRHADPDTGSAPTPGDLSLAGTALTLDPVGPGPSIGGACDSVTETGSGDDTMLTVVCTFDDVPINTYLVTASAGSDYFAGHANGVLTVYDPASGEVEGGGTFLWDGDPTEFGFTMDYNKKGTNLKGSFLLIRHTSAGDYIVKSNSLYGMATGVDASTAWATFAGKATLTWPSGDTYGNHEFVVRVTDDPDTFWIELRDKDRVPVDPMSMPRDGAGEPIDPVAVLTGEVVVPKGKGGKK